MDNRIDLWGITQIALWLIFALAIVVSSIVVSCSASAGARARIDTFFKLIVPLLTIGFFLYKAIGGALFATTSLTLDAKRIVGDPESIFVTATIERGSNWLVEIQDAVYIFSVNGIQQGRYRNMGFPRTGETPFPRAEGDRLGPVPTSLKLAPGEKTATQFRLEAGSLDEVEITAYVSVVAVTWPIPSWSFARALVPAHRTTVSQ